MKALVGAFNQEKALVWAFFVIVKTSCGTDRALHSTSPRARDTSRGLETPKLRPVPRQQFTIKEPPAAVRANLNPKLSSPAAAARSQQQEAAKAELKSSRSETPASRVTRVRSTSSAR